MSQARTSRYGVSYLAEAWKLANGNLCRALMKYRADRSLCRPDGSLLRPVELVGRRAMLKKLIRRAAPVLIFSEHMDAAHGERMFRHACALGLEGIVSKRLDKPYSSGRCHHWRKVKNPSYVRP
jgi:hypothetical protein